MYRLRPVFGLSVLAFWSLGIGMTIHGPPRPPPKAAGLMEATLASQPPQDPLSGTLAGFFSLLKIPPGTTEASRAPVAPQAAPVAAQSLPAPILPPVMGNAAIWACIRAHESGGNYQDDTGNGYYGAYQFLQSTWNAIARRFDPALVGVRPSATSPSTQDQMAIWLQETSGWGQWSTAVGCGA